MTILLDSRADRDPTLLTEARVEHLERKIEHQAKGQYDKRHSRYICSPTISMCINSPLHSRSLRSLSPPWAFHRSLF
jgi:hypothetical protein